jgi:dTDP-4-amino-4,6-dideoxygalactose transaminase
MMQEHVPIPFLDLNQTTKRIAAQALTRWEALLAQSDFISGKPVQELEAALAAKCQVSHTVACANGTDAIILALQAAGVGCGMRIALPNLTFWATYEAVVHVGGAPVLIDIDSNHFQINFDELMAEHRREPLSAVIVVHLFGWCHPQLSELRAFCASEEIVLIEDGAQSFGVSLQTTEGQPESVFKDATIATLSFYPAKVLGGCMDGGAITTNSPELEQRIRRLLNHGRVGHYSYSDVGWNSRMSSLQGAYLSLAVEIVDQLIHERLAALSYYQQKIEETFPKEEVSLITAPPSVIGNGYLAVLMLPQGRNLQMQSELAQRGITTARTYPETIHQQAPAARAARSSELSVSTLFCQRVLNVPLFPGITRDAQDIIIHSLQASLQS